MNREQNFWIKEWEYKAVEKIDMNISKFSICSFWVYWFKY